MSPNIKKSINVYHILLDLAVGYRDANGDLFCLCEKKKKQEKKNHYVSLVLNAIASDLHLY